MLSFNNHICRRVYIPLPDTKARETILNQYLAARLQKCDEAQEALIKCAEKTAGYSGADLRLLCKEAAMCPLRHIVKQLEDGKKVRFNAGLCYEPSHGSRVIKIAMSIGVP